MNKHRFTLLVFFIIGLIKAQQVPNFTITGNANGSTLNCYNPTLSFSTTTAYNGTVNYTWAGPTATLTGPSVVINAPGVYTVNATAGAFTAGQLLTVYSNTTAPTSSVSPIGQNITCLVAAATITAIVLSPSNNVEQSFYSPTGGVFSVFSTAAYYAPNSPGTYTYIALNLTNGCTTTKTVVIASTDAFPVFTVSSPQNYTIGCGTQSVASVIISTVAPSPAITYTLISPANFNYTTGSLMNYTVNAPGTYTVIVKDNATNCQAKVPVTIVQNLTVPDVSISTAGYTLNCYTPTLSLQGSSSVTNMSYSWQSSFNPFNTSGNTLTVSAATYTGNAFSSTYTLSFTYAGNGCSNNMQFSIYKNMFPPNANISSNGTVLTCTTPTISLANASSSGIPPNSPFPVFLGTSGVLWEGPAPQPTATGSSYAAATPGIYTLTAMDNNNGCTAKATKIITGTGSPLLYTNTLVCLNGPGPVLLASNVPGPAANYNFTWLVPQGAQIANATTGTLSTNTAGVYTLTVVEAATSCSASTQITVGVCTGIETQQEMQAFHIFPNPTTGKLTVRFQNTFTNAEISVYNSRGEKVKNITVNATNEIDLQEEAKGLYFVELREEGKLIYVTKVIRE